MSQTLARLNPIRRGSGEHTHGFVQLLFGLSGSVHCALADTAFDVGAGEIGVVPRDALHYYAGASDDSRLLVVDVDLGDEMMGALARLAPDTDLESVFVTPTTRAAPGEFTGLIGTASRQLARHGAAGSLVARQWATLFAVQTAAMLAEPTSRVDDRTERLQALIDARLAAPPDNADIQRHLAMSGSALNQWCHLVYGMSPQQIVLRRRLAWARQWLTETARPIGQIAHDAGFADAPTFTRAFRRIYVTTPAAARRRAMQSVPATPPRAVPPSR